VPARQRHHHEPRPVAAGEVLAVLAVDGVAQALALRPDDLRLGEQPQVAGGGQSDVLQGKGDARAGPGPIAPQDGGDDGQRGIQPACHVPGGQHVVDGPGVIGGAGDERESDARVHGVVHSGRAVAAAQQLDVDEVGALRRQVLVVQPRQAGGVGDDDAVALDNQAPHQLLALRGAQIEADGSFPLVQPGPINRGAVAGQRPTVHVGRTSDRVDPDHLCTELVQRQAAQRSGDEAGHLDHGESCERPGSGHAPTRSNTAARPCPPPMHMVSSP